MADDTTPLASLSLTHVYYDPSDPVSFVCAWLALVPQALCIVYVTLIWSSRELEVALMFAGQLACEAVNFALKRLIKEERPRRIHGKGYGMPSSHAQFVAFWALSLALFLLVRHRPRSRNRGGSSPSSSTNANITSGVGEDAVVVDVSRHEKAKDKNARQGEVPAAATASTPPSAAATANSTSATAAALVAARDRWQQAQRDLLELYGIHSYPHRPWSMPERAAVSLLGFVLAAMVAWSRTYLGYHTARQVLVGSLAGTVSALAWFAACTAARRLGLLAWAIDLPAARWFRVRDLVVEEDLCQAGWEKWEDRRGAGLVAAAASKQSPVTVATEDSHGHNQPTGKKKVKKEPSRKDNKG